MNNSVVITGLGIISPLNPGGETDIFWKALCEGKNAVRNVPPEIKGYPHNVAAWIDRKFDKTNPKALIIAEDAFSICIKDSGINVRSLDPDRLGICLGTVLGDILSGQEYLKKKIEGMNGIEAGKMLRTYPLPSIASYLAKNFSINGLCITVSTACSSGNDAIGIASRKILLGKADVIFAGGVDVLSDFAFSGFSSLQAMTFDKVRPFDKKRTGLALGEGAAFLMLERETHALERKAKIYGRVSGYASRSDATHLTGPHKEGRGLADAIRSALAEADIKPESIDYISAHGTGTIYNDLMETKAIKSAFGKNAYDVSISSIKSMLGHSFGCAAVIEAASCLLAMERGVIPPTINYEISDSECDLDYTPNISKKIAVKTCVSISAGFGGQNAAIVLEKERRV